MFSKAWIPVRLARDIADTETSCGDYAKGQVGFVQFQEEHWFFRPLGTRDDFGFFLEQEDFRVIRSMKPEPQEYLRHMSLPYKIVYTSCYIKPAHLPDDGTQIGERADAAINLLVRYAEELEKQIEELQNELANTQQS